jgi:hypothetical protein
MSGGVLSLGTDVHYRRLFRNDKNSLMPIIDCKVACRFSDVKDIPTNVKLVDLTLMVSEWVDEQSFC